jgi:hypothetical protein
MSLWPLLGIYEMPKYVPGDAEQILARKNVWSLMEEIGTVAFIGKQSQGVTFTPFSTEKEVGYDYMALQEAIYTK